MLTPKQVEICHNTISANAFLWLVRDAVEKRSRLSVVRAADGEKKILDHLSGSSMQGVLQPFGGLTTEWFKKYGCDGIPQVELFDRLVEAISSCTYFAPSINGIAMPAYNVYDLREGPYVDNFFPNLWNEEQKRDLFKLAGHVLFIHGDRKLADAMQARAKHYYGVKVSYLPLSNWDQAEGVIESANRIDAPLTIFSSGPASKFIGPRINRVTLDIGAAAYRWSFLPEFEKRKAQAAASGCLDQFIVNPYGKEVYP